MKNFICRFIGHFPCHSRDYRIDEKGHHYVIDQWYFSWCGKKLNEQITKLS